MAEEEMVGIQNDPFLRVINEAISSLEASHGPLYAAMLAHLPERPPNDWVLLVGSKRLLARRLDGIRAIVNAIKGLIPKRYATRIRRVDVLRPDDPLYLHLSRALKVAHGADVTLQNCGVFGLEVDHAVIFAMNAIGRKLAAMARPRKHARRRTAIAS